MTPEARIEELSARISLAQGSPSLLVVVAESDATLDEARKLLVGILQRAQMRVEDLGACDVDMGPARWVELTHERAADAYVLSAAPWGPFSGGAFAGLLNAEREFLRRLAGPVLLVVSRDTERILRQKAPDFFTWAARTYELPAPAELVAIARKLGALPDRAPGVPSEEPPIRFLHLSDLHLRPQRVKRYDQDRVLRGLVDFLEQDHQRFPLDLIFITGDLAHSGKPEEFELVVDLFQRILDVTGVPPSHFFVVPGNHDVDRDVGRWLRRTLDKDEEAIVFFEDEHARRFHTQKLEAYRVALASLLGEDRTLGLGVGANAVEVVTVRGARIAVASFNSAFFAQGDDDHGKLWLGEPNVDRAGDRIADEGAQAAIALLHHPFEELHELERDIIEHRFERLFDLVLRGHMHQPKSRGIASQRGGFVELAAPSAYQGSPWPNGCLLGELRPRSGKVRITPYMYASGADPWVLDTKVFPDDAKDGYTHTFAVPEKKRTPSVLRRHLAQATEEAVEAAPEAVQRQVAKVLGIEAPSSRMPKEVAKKVARAAAAKVDDPALLANVVDERRMSTALSKTAADELEAGGPTRIPRSDPQFLEKALGRVAEFIHRKVSGKVAKDAAREEMLVQLIATALSHIVDGPVSVERLLPDAGRPHIVIGAPNDTPAIRSIIGVHLVSKLGDWALSDVPEKRLERLDLHLESGHAEHGALVEVYTGEGDAVPRIERTKTPSGQNVLVLHLFW
ncbi:metallophosphoesterase family protein [Polyangium jinanense]|uniref:Metallophosphoesterase n=1 Tax=Polyangium jinanense TaxID=2829994 RepID=A0A9X3WYE6_9BACT|nr:metallophosphoesterase [Polyangium jinanense]MDC3953846.1 metallophosphoesterase [Polyangium jinanense]MDC3979033.1 metallophosphoesterase [Polyangium jinanense]